ncbi:HD-GYP domain-containing protein [Pseudomonas sp. LP_7_YM]|uniref:HD-GYP domain-containing protein n=1 Tax=Pseudomonas sp. LP_7_YM TaxID=2485137 RepID=UPI001060610F|nr:HD-GYP domain-containing protein [Pseudomonas sp. LP_7_YM]TDV69790.1 putative nucleotidyltransferase with HDIG domain [Pseudomonas sp. LP_7_YM]
MLRKIAVCDLTLGMYIHEFCRPRNHDPFWTLHVERKLLDEGVLQRIQESTRQVWIDTGRGKSPEPQVHILAAASERVSESDTAPASMERELTRARMICGRAKDAVTVMFTDARMGRAMNVKDVDLLVEEISTSVMRHPHALISLSRLKTSDEYTYMHSVAVCALMVALARQMELNEELVREAGVAGLMHDVGKMMIAPAILNKPARLTVDEYEAMKYHPQAGLEILEHCQQVTSAVRDVCLHHHEKIDGSGYPHGLKGEEISLFAKMGAVCDVYDAVTSDRPYKKGWDAARSIREMASWKGHFDEKILQHFVKTVGIYPVGALVRLKSERLGVVVEQGEKSLLHPKVKVFLSTRTRIAFEPHVINLANPVEKDAIIKFELAEDWGVQDVEKMWAGAGAS